METVILDENKLADRVEYMQCEIFARVVLKDALMRARKEFESHSFFMSDDDLLDIAYDALQIEKKKSRCES
jgi:hypothetical protein